MSGLGCGRHGLELRRPAAGGNSSPAVWGVPDKGLRGWSRSGFGRRGRGRAGSRGPPCKERVGQRNRKGGGGAVAAVVIGAAALAMAGGAGGCANKHDKDAATAGRRAKIP